MTVSAASEVEFPAPVDSNSPAVWNGGELIVFNSTGDGVIRSQGPGQSRLEQPEAVVLGPSSHHPYWIEAAWMDDDGSIFAWYHHEPQGVCGSRPLTAPQIGALWSGDGGKSFLDLGIILESPYPLDCSSRNGYFAGGNGDFSVALSRDKQYLYFLFSNYGGPQDAQGVAVARLAFDQRNNPVGAVQKFYKGEWNEPGLRGRVTAIFPAKVIWSRADADAFWGPSVHWNSYLQTWVMLLNHSCCAPGWPQEGIYVSFNPDLREPHKWTPPQKVLSGPGWYPQVLGLGADGTDKLAGQRARLYAYGISEWELQFSR